MRRPTPAAKFVEIERKTGGLSRNIVSVFLSFRPAVLRFLCSPRIGRTFADRIVPVASVLPAEN
jgi:hypothetical protein